MDPARGGKTREQRGEKETGRETRQGQDYRGDYGRRSRLSRPHAASGKGQSRAENEEPQPKGEKGQGVGTERTERPHYPP